MKLQFLLWCLVALGLQVEAYPGGAPAAACSNLMPRHGSNSGQTTESPYELDLSLLRNASGNCYSYQPMMLYNLSLITKAGRTEDFEGFFIQSRLVADGTTLTGTYTPLTDGTRFHSCMPETAGITHNITGLADHHFRQIPFQWTAPSANRGTIKFHYTVVHDFDEFWVNIQSPLIEEGTCTSPAHKIIAMTTLVVALLLVFIFVHM